MSEKESNLDYKLTLGLVKFSIGIVFLLMLILGIDMSFARSEIREMKKKIDKIEEKVEFKMYLDKCMENQKNE